MTPLQRTRLEKAAADCGFDLSPQWEGDALRMCSNQFPETVLVRGLSDDEFEVLASNPVLLPREAPKDKALLVSGWKNLYGVLDAASACARTLPNRVAQRFKAVTAHMPKSTEAERLVVRRVGHHARTYKKNRRKHRAGKARAHRRVVNSIRAPLISLRAH